MKSDMLKPFFLFLLLLTCLSVSAQVSDAVTSHVSHGENVVYDVYFKWGVIMPRAGEASFSFSKNRSVADASSCYRLLFKTAKFFDAFFKMRDTLSCYYDSECRPVFSTKRTDDGDYYSVDEISYNRDSSGKTTVHSLRYTPNRVKIDTVMTAEGYVTDFLGAFFFLRQLDRNGLESGDMFPVTVAIGRDLINVKICYHNRSIVTRGNVKFNTRYFTVDIYDDAFETTNTSAEVWVGDDDNFLPVKVRSKLKIGYTEIYYRSSSGLAHPLDCRFDAAP